MVARNGAVRLPRNAKRAAAGPVSTEHVHPRAMREARRLAGGDAGRVRVLDSRTVIVVNSARMGLPGRKRGRK